jgi:hypothetical protein
MPLGRYRSYGTQDTVVFCQADETEAINEKNAAEGGLQPITAVRPPPALFLELRCYVSSFVERLIAENDGDGHF